MHQITEGHHRNSEKGNVHRESQRSDPGCQSGTDIGSHDNSNGIAKSKKSCIHETYHHDGSCRRRLHKAGHYSSGKHTLESIGCHLGHEGSESVTCRFLETLAHKCHTVEEHCKSSKYGKHIKNCCHIKSVLL